MNRTPYIMKEEEIRALIAGFVKYGSEDIYIKMKTKALFVMDKIDDLDEEFLDRANILLMRGRKELHDDNEDSLKDIYYTLSFMLRKLAHEIYRKYIKNGRIRDNDRFLRIVSNNKEAPSLLI